MARTLQQLAEAANMADIRTAQLFITDEEWAARRDEFFRLQAQLDACRLAYAATEAV